MTVCRLWRGWTTPENADAYERIVRGEVIPGIEARRIPGFRHIDLMKRDLGGEIDGDTVEVHLADAAAPTLLRENDKSPALYVLMPMRV